MPPVSPNLVCQSGFGAVSLILVRYDDEEHALPSAVGPLHAALSASSTRTWTCDQAGGRRRTHD